MQANRRRCPYCRSIGSVLELHKELHRLHPPNNPREREEKVIARLSAAVPEMRPALHDAEASIRRKRRLLGLHLGALKRCCERTYDRLLFPGRRASKGGSPRSGGTWCGACGEGIRDFSCLSSQACGCGALYHATCLQRVVSETPDDRIPCCPSCSSASIIFEGVPLKRVAREAASAATVASSPCGETRAEGAGLAQEVRQQQGLQLEHLNRLLRLVASARLGLGAGEVVRDAAPKRRRGLLAHLPP